jgi:hypothetical protein
VTRKCDDAVASGRMTKADQFLQAAEDIGDLADDDVEVQDAVVTLLVHAGNGAALAKRLKQLLDTRPRPATHIGR